MSLSPAELSHALRRSADPHLRRRRAVAALDLVAIGSMAVISLYQLGLIPRMPELNLPLLDADAVDASPEAYGRLRMPDAPLGLASYSLTLALASVGGPERARTLRLVPLALAAKAAIDAAQAGRLTVDQWVRHRAFCSWCLLAAGATFAALPLTLPEAWAAPREVSGLRKKLALRVSRAAEGEGCADRQE